MVPGASGCAADAPTSTGPTTGEKAGDEVMRAPSRALLMELALLLLLLLLLLLAAVEMTPLV